MLAAGTDDGHRKRIVQEMLRDAEEMLAQVTGKPCLYTSRLVCRRGTAGLQTLCWRKRDFEPPVPSGE
jgi:hypothetical protein